MKMKKKDLFLNIVIGVLSAAIVVVALYKFVIVNEPQKNFGFKDFHRLEVTDLNGNPLNVASLMSETGDTYLLVFDLKDCPSCIFRGKDEIKHLREAGKHGFVIMVHDSIEEVSGWASANDVSPIFMMKRVDFYDHVHTSRTPVVVKMRKDNVESFRFITP